jgi:hypothetical protein
MLPQLAETTDDTLKMAIPEETESAGHTVSNESSETAVEVEEIRTEQAPAGKVHSRKAAPEKKEEPNPLLLDPYEFDHCTITIVYTRVGDQQASVSVHNHKDDPIVKTFPLVEVPLPLEIACVIERLLEIWPDARVSVTMALLPREGETERRMAVSIRTGGDTPIVLAGPASEFPLPPPITALLDELKELLPTRAMQKIEKEAKEKSKTPSKAAPAKLTSSSPTKLTPGQVDGKTQMTLF